MVSLYRLYFDRDASLLDRAGLPAPVRRAWLAHWAGDLVRARDEYLAVDWESCEPRARALARADRALIEVKRGAPLPEVAPESVFEYPEARIVYLYARFTRAFWVNHAVARTALRALLWQGVARFDLDLCTMALFLIGHMWAIRGGTRIGLTLSSLMFRRVAAKLERRDSSAPFFNSIVLAAYPYTRVVTGRISGRMEEAVRIGEQHLPQDPYYLSVFLVSALYGYAYTGDTARAEIYSARLAKQQELGKLVRYRPVSRIMALLPYAVRGHGGLIEQEFDAILEAHDRAEADPLINSQFYRAAAIIALYQGRNPLAARLIAHAEEERARTGSFRAWAPFDRRIRELSARSRSFDPRVDTLMSVPTRFETPPSLGALLLDLMQALSRSPEAGKDAFVAEVMRLVRQHVEWNDFVDLESVPDESSADPCIRVGDRYLRLCNLPADRALYVRDIFAALSPVLRRLVEQCDGLLRSRELAHSAATVAAAAQVAHDIKSPLAALQVVLKDLSGVPEENRTLLRIAVTRIHDIANSLIQSHSHNLGSVDLSGDYQPNEALSVELLPALVDGLVSEKRVQYRARMGVEIRYELGAYGRGPFAQVQPIELKRVLSNLVNNAVEALPPHGGQVTLDICQVLGEVHLRVRDTGRGIPAERIPLLAKRGGTYDKPEGTGLGLYHAQSSARRWGGAVEIRSRSGEGTEILLRLPARQPPKWFVPELLLGPGASRRVAVVDDDSSVHQIWRGRLEKGAAAETLDEVAHFTLASEFREWMSAQSPAQSAETLYLVDYELLGSGIDGLSLIDELGIAAQSMLVTSHSEDARVRERCLALGVRLIPKGMAGSVPIIVSEAGVRPGLRMGATQGRVIPPGPAYGQSPSLQRSKTDSIH